MPDAEPRPERIVKVSVVFAGEPPGELLWSMYDVRSMNLPISPEDSEMLQMQTCIVFRIEGSKRCVRRRCEDVLARTVTLRLEHLANIVIGANRITRVTDRLDHLLRHRIDQARESCVEQSDDDGPEILPVVLLGAVNEPLFKI